MAKATRGPSITPMLRSYSAEGGDIARGLGVIQGTNDDQVKKGTSTGRTVGVAQEKIVDKERGAVVELGDVTAIAGGAVNAGDRVKSDAAGKFVASSAEDAETAGVARSTAAGLDDEFLLFVQPNHKRS